MSFVGGEKLRPTGRHPLYSLDRDDWVRVRSPSIDLPQNGVAYCNITHLVFWEKKRFWRRFYTENALIDTGW